MEFSGYDINKYSPRQMVALPLVLLLLAGVLLGYTMLTTGLPDTGHRLLREERGHGLHIRQQRDDRGNVRRVSAPIGG